MVVLAVLIAISSAAAVGGLFTFKLLWYLRKDNTLAASVAALICLVGVAGMVLTTIALNILVLFLKR